MAGSDGWDGTGWSGRGWEDDFDRLRSAEAAAGRRAERAEAERLRGGLDLRSVLIAVAETGDRVLVVTTDGVRRPVIVAGVGADVVTALRDDGSTVYLPIGAVRTVECGRDIGAPGALGGPLTLRDALEYLAGEAAPLTIELVGGDTYTGTAVPGAADLVRVDMHTSPRRSAYITVVSITAVGVLW